MDWKGFYDFSMSLVLCLTDFYTWLKLYTDEREEGIKTISSTVLHVLVHLACSSSQSSRLSRQQIVAVRNSTDRSLSPLRPACGRSGQRKAGVQERQACMHSDAFLESFPFGLLHALSFCLCGTCSALSIKLSSSLLIASFWDSVMLVV